jgi:hypothetical protein
LLRFHLGFVHVLTVLLEQAVAIETRLEHRGYLIHLAVVEEPSKRIYKVQIGHEEQGHFVPQLPGFTKEFSRMVGATNAMVAVRKQAQTEVDKHLGLFKERIDRPLHRR